MSAAAPPRQHERGQVLPLLAVVVVAAALAAVGVGKVGEVIVARARAEAAADAAALAGAAHGEGAASALASRNGAAIVSYRAAGGEVEVVVAVHGQQARSRASDS